jgi:hypothetical protein
MTDNVTVNTFFFILVLLACSIKTHRCHLSFVKTFVARSRLESEKKMAIVLPYFKLE